MESSSVPKTTSAKSFPKLSAAEQDQVIAEFLKFHRLKPPANK